MEYLKTKLSDLTPHVPTQQRKVIQITGTTRSSGTNQYAVVVALCNDGAMFSQVVGARNWRRMSAIPQGDNATAEEAEE